MNPTTLTYYVFGGLFLVLLIAVIVLHLQRRRREQERLDAMESANRAAHPELEPTPPLAPNAASSVSPVAAAASLFAGNSPTQNPTANPAQVAMTTSAGSAPGPMVGGSMHPSYIASWSPPTQKAFQPATEQIYKVSWANTELFGKEPEAFDEPSNIPKITADQVPTTDKNDFVFGTATPVMASVVPMTNADSVSKELQQAGYYQPHAMQNLSAVRFALMFVGFIITGGIVLLLPPRFEMWGFLSMLIVPVMAWAVPRVRIQQIGTNRKSELERAMPDMLDMLNMCVSQGLTIPASLKRIAKDLRPIYPVLASELQIVTHQADVGSMRVALDNFAQRVDVPEVDSFVTLMNQSDRMGTNVSDALTEYSNTMRESLRQRTDEKAGKAAFQLMFPTVLFMMPAVFCFLMGPAIVELQRFFDNGGMQNIQNGTNATQAVNNANRNPQAAP